MKIKENQISVIKTSVFWLILFYIVISLYKILVVDKKAILDWKDKYQVAQQRGDTCLHNFEVISPQIEQGEIYLRLDNDKEAGQSGVVK